MAQPDENVPWLVDNAIAPGTLNGFAGAPKVGKSVLLRQMAAQVAVGGEWLGRTCTQVNVLWIGTEDTARIARNQFQDMDCDPEAPLHVWNGFPPDPSIMPTAEWLDRLIALHKAGLVLVENFGKLVTIDDFNDYSVVSAALRPYEALATTSRAAIVVGLHTRKSGGDDGQAVLGSTQFTGGPSTIFELTRDGDNRYLSSIQREGTGLERTMLKWHPSSRTYTPGLSKSAADAELVADEILIYLREGAGSTTAEIADAISRKRQAVTRALNRMVDDGWGTKSGKGRAGAPYRFSLSDGPEDWSTQSDGATA